MSFLDKFRKKQQAFGPDAALKKTPAFAKTAPTPAADKTAPSESHKLAAGGKLAYKVLLRPLITEKSTAAESAGKYSFMVDGRADKAQIKRAIAEAYGVKPVKVAVINLEGKKVRYGRTFGRRRDWRKAIVTLPQGKSISIHEGV